MVTQQDLPVALSRFQSVLYASTVNVHPVVHKQHCCIGGGSKIIRCLVFVLDLLM